MKKLLDEKGSTLIIVLLSLTLLMMLGIVLITQSITTAKQREQTESIYRSTHIAEMGVTLTKKKIEEYIRNNPVTENLSDYASDMFNEVDEQVDTYIIDEEHPSRKFSLEKVNVLVDNEKGTIEAILTVVGMDEKKDQTLNATIIIEGLKDGSENQNNGFDDWLVQSQTLPEKPTEGHVYNTWIDWKNISFQSNENLVLDNGGKFKNSNVSVNHFYSDNSVMIENTSFSIEGIAKFDYFQLDQNSNITIGSDLYVTNYLQNTKGNPSLKVCGNTILYNGMRFSGKLEFGQHLIINSRLTLKNANFLSNGTVLLNGGMDIENGSTTFIVGGDLILNQNAGASSINTSNDLIVLGDLILKNVPQNQNFLFNIKNNLLVSGDVLLYYQGQEEPIINPSNNFMPEIQQYNSDKGKKNDKGKIIYNYPNQVDIFIEGCSKPNHDQDPNLQSPVVEITNVDY